MTSQKNGICDHARNYLLILSDFCCEIITSNHAEIKVIYFGLLTILVLQQIDLPPERAKILRGYNMTKKWEMICDHVRNSQLF